MRYLIACILILSLQCRIFAQDTAKAVPVNLTEKERPMFPGGEKELRKYLALNLRYPNTALEQKVEGYVILTFKINTAGKVSDVKVLKGLGAIRDQIIAAFNKAKGGDAQYNGIGSLKLTIQKFYRVNGGSTQLKGVTPDINLPDPYEQLDNIGERKDLAALPWDKIKPAEYNVWSVPPALDMLRKNSEKRVSGNETFKLIQQTGERLKKQQDNNVVSLNETKYIEKQKESQALSKKIEELDKMASPVTVSNLKVDLSRINVDTTSKTKNNDWLKALQKDVYLSETANIMYDWITTPANVVNIKRSAAE